VVTAARGTAVAVLTAAGGGGPGIGRKAAQQLARAELAKPEYHHHVSPLEAVILAVLHFLARIVNAASGAVPGGWWALVALAALAVIATAVVLNWIGPLARAHRGSGPLASEGGARTARDHRQEAQRLAGAGDYTAAIIECVRAIAAELEERGMLPPRIGRTADEFAAEAGRALPAHADALRDAARQFDEIRYGQRPGSRAGYERLSELDRRIMAGAPRASRPGGAGASRVMAGGPPS
jgi:Domain of unknown function (DUF4129)